LVAYLYGDLLLQALPAHRLPALARLASTLALPRLAVLCLARANEAAAGLFPGLGAASGLRVGGSAVLAAPPPPPAPSTFLQDMAAACPRAVGAPPPAFSDVAVLARSGGEVATFPAHRVILCRAAYFRAQLFGFAEVPASALTLEDAEPAVVAALLEALYSGDIAACAQPDRALAALALASRLCLTDVCQRLQDAVCDAAQPADAAVLAGFAEVHSLPQLARIAAGLAASAAPAAE